MNKKYMCDDCERKFRLLHLFGDKCLCHNCYFKRLNIIYIYKNNRKVVDLKDIFSKKYLKSIIGV